MSAHIPYLHRYAALRKNIIHPFDFSYETLNRRHVETFLINALTLTHIILFRYFTHAQEEKCRLKTRVDEVYTVDVSRTNNMEEVSLCNSQWVSAKAKEPNFSSAEQPRVNRFSYQEQLPSVNSVHCINEEVCCCSESVSALKIRLVGALRGKTKIKQQRRRRKRRRISIRQQHSWDEKQRSRKRERWAICFHTLGG